MSLRPIIPLGWWLRQLLHAITDGGKRINLFTPQEVFARLEQRFTLLTAGALDMPTRQQTLRRAIDWSYELLNDEQTLFRWLGVFVGGCMIEAAEAVCGRWELGVGRWGADAAAPIPISQLPTPILEGLAALVDKSLLQREDGIDGRSRYTMLETIREYARERLAEAGELERAQERHLAYELALAEAAEPLLSTSDQRVWLDRLEVGVALSLVVLAAVMIEQQELIQTAQLLGTAEPQDWLDWTVAERAEYDHSVAAIRAHLDQAAFAAAWAAGRAMTLEQALAEALAIATQPRAS